MDRPFIITKTPKSIGIAILLALLFGPIGLFYATISGAILMIVLPVFIGLIFIAGILQDNEIILFFSTGIAILFILIYWLLNIVIAVRGVNQYNKRLEEEAQKQYELWKVENRSGSQNERNNDQKSNTIPGAKHEENASSIPTPREWLKNNPNMSINDYFSRFGS